MHISEDLSLFIGLATVPPSKEKEFYEKDIRDGIFKNYKKVMMDGGIIENAKVNAGQQFKELKSSLYKPKAFSLFGNFDLAIVSLIDDFNLGSRSFHPYSYLIGYDKPKKQTRPFNYQVFTGPGLKVFTSIADENLLCKSKRTFLSDSQSTNLPFIGIACFKVNNGILIGAGGIAVELIETAIQGVIHQLKVKRTSEKSDFHLDYILTESYGWHEITLLLFSDSYKNISDVIIRLRELRFEQLAKLSKVELIRRREKLSDIMDSKQNGTGRLRKERVGAISEEINKIDNYINKYIDSNIESIIKNSFIGSKVRKGSDFSKLIDKNIALTHLFVNTYSILGIDSEVLRKGHVNQSYISQLENANVALYSKWHIKPGHISAGMGLHFSGKRKELEKREKMQVVFGSGDVILQKSASDLREVIETNAKLSNEENPNDFKHFNSHVIKINSVPSVVYPYKKLSKELIEDGYWLPLSKFSKHAFISQELKRYAFGLPQIKLIRQKLFKIKCSKILREKVLNMFANFNDGIQDVVLYSYFIELRPYLEKVMKLVTEEYSQKESFYGGKYLNEIQNELDILVDHFDKAFKNRFHQSYRMNEITDFNMEHNGGIQQIVSSFDAAFKTLTRVMGEEEQPISFAMVSGLSGIDSSLFHVRLNSFHVFFPSLFVAVIVKEAANKFLQKREIGVKFKSDAVNLSDIEVFKKMLSDPTAKEAWISDVIDNSYNGNQYNYGKYELAELLSWFNPEMLDYFVADSLAYGYGYANRPSLFAYWQWNYSMQLTEQYDKDGSFNEQAFIKLMIRFTFLSVNFNDFQKDWTSLTKNPPSPLLNNYWFRYKDKVNEVFKLISESDMIKSIKATISNLLVHAIDRSLASKNINKNEFHSNAMSTYLNGGGDIVDTIDESKTELLENWTKLTTYQAKKAKSRIERGKTYIYKSQGDVTPQQYLIALFMAYLEMIYDLNNKQENKLHVIIRKDTSYLSKRSAEHEIPENPTSYVPMAFDSLGGFFTTDASVRRRFFQYRCAFIKSLYDFSLKSKTELFTTN